jgi:hypothetical protein
MGMRAIPSEFGRFGNLLFYCKYFFLLEICALLSYIQYIYVTND